MIKKKDDETFRGVYFLRISENSWKPSTVKVSNITIATINSQ